jgi:LL-diaminopimelate aminotransferase
LLTEAGIEYYPALSMPYLWVRLKRGRVSLSFARSLLRRQAIVVAPGSAFGEEGEGWVRIAANMDEACLRNSVAEIVKHCQPLRARLRDRRK